MVNALHGWKLNEFFTIDEFACRGEQKGEPCCCHGAVLLDAQLVRALELLRVRVAHPIFLTCAFRCETWNKHVGGASNSHHPFGMAADITSPEIREDEESYAKTCARIVVDLVGKGFGNVHFYPDRGFIHVDVAKSYDPAHVIHMKLATTRKYEPYDWKA